MISKLINYIKRGLTSNTTSDECDIPSQQIKYLNKSVTAERLSPYGLSSNPEVNTPVIIFNIIGSEENQTALAYSADSRIRNLSSGDVVLHSPKSGAFVKVSANGEIIIQSVTKMSISAPELNITSPEITVDCDNFTVNASNSIELDGDTSLGTGGEEIARKGDPVIESSPNMWEIQSGSSRHTAD